MVYPRAAGGRCATYAPARMAVPRGRPLGGDSGARSPWQGSGGSAPGAGSASIPTDLRIVPHPRPSRFPVPPSPRSPVTWFPAHRLRKESGSSSKTQNQGQRGRGAYGGSNLGGAASRSTCGGAHVSNTPRAPLPPNGRQWRKPEHHLSDDPLHKKRIEPHFRRFHHTGLAPNQNTYPSIPQEHK